MAKAKVMTGARAKIYVKDVLVGLFDSCTYSVNIGAEAIHIVGRYSPTEITQTSYEAVSVQCSGFRIIGKQGGVGGVLELLGVSTLNDLLILEGIKIDIIDRQSTDKKAIMTVSNCIATSYSTGVNAKATSRIQVTYLGTHHSDESGPQDEGDASIIS